MTKSPAARPVAFDSTTSPTAAPSITSPIFTGSAYVRIPVMRPRMYGSTDQYLLFTSTCPSDGAAKAASTSEKSDSFGKPTGRAASLNCRFTDGFGPECAADIGTHYLSDEG